MHTFDINTALITQEPLTKVILMNGHTGYIESTYEDVKKNLAYAKEARTGHFELTDGTVVTYHGIHTIVRSCGLDHFRVFVLPKQPLKIKKMFEDIEAGFLARNRRPTLETVLYYLNEKIRNQEYYDSCFQKKRTPEEQERIMKAIEKTDAIVKKIFSKS